MLRSDGPLKSIDWRGWLALVWVIWFGMLYGKMVIEKQAGKISEIVPLISSRPSEVSRTR